MREVKLSGTLLTQLYERIGGEAALERILNRFYEKMSQDVLIGFFFDGKDIHHIASMQRQFLMRAWGVAPSYSGKTPAKAHDDIAPILVGHFDRRLVILADTLREFGVSEEDINMWINFEDKFRHAIQKTEKVKT